MSDTSTLKKDLEPVFNEIIDSIKKGSDLDSVLLYKKVIKKSVPFHLRSYFTAFLLKAYLNRGKKKSFKKDGEKSVFINIGKNRRVYPSDLIQLVSKTAEISKEDIGSIKILDNYSFVSIADASAQNVIDKLDGTEFRGRKLTVNFAKKNI